MQEASTKYRYTVRETRTRVRFETRVIDPPATSADLVTGNFFFFRELPCEFNFRCINLQRLGVSFLFVRGRNEDLQDLGVITFLFWRH